MKDAGELFTDSAGPAKPKRNWSAPEHALQVQVHKLARAFITVPHVFLAFDRVKKQTERQYIYEAARGVRRGTLDTVTMALGVRDFWCELKIHPNKVREGDSQWDMIADLRACGRHAGVAYTVSEWLALAQSLGIPLLPGAKVAAMRMDALLESGRTKAKAPRSYKPRAPRETTPSRKAISIWNKMQAPR